jgi:hypothetical protein
VIIINKVNLYLSFLLFSLIAIILLFIDIEYCNVISILLISIINIVIIFYLNITINKKLFLLLLFIGTYYYIYSIIMQAPVGYQDVHDHINQYNLIFQNYHVDFESAQRVSYNFILLYLVTICTISIVNIDIVYFSIFIPSMICIFSCLFIYIISLKLTNNYNVAFSATILYGYENIILTFGHEYRSQTIGLLFILILIYIIISNYNNNKIRYVTLLFLIFIAIAITSFVIIMMTLLFLISYIILNKLLAQNNKIINTYSLLIFITLTFTYLLYASDGFSYLIQSLNNMYNESLLESSGSINVGENIYGELVSNFNYVVWIIYIIIFIYIFTYLLKNKKPILILILSLSVILLSGVIFVFFIDFSIGRFYTLGFFSIAFTISYGFYYLECVKNKPIFKHVLAIFIVLFIIFSFLKIPTYVIGDLEPLRSEQPIDKVSYWDRDDPQYSIASYIQNNYENTSINYQGSIINFVMLGIVEKNGILLTNESSNILIQDKFMNEKFTGRYQFSNLTSMYNNSLVYNNYNYILYLDNH